MNTYVVYAAIEKPRSAYNETLDGRLITRRQQEALDSEEDVPRWLEALLPMDTDSFDDVDARDLLLRLDTPVVSVETEDGESVITRQYFVVAGTNRDAAIDSVAARCDGREPSWDVLSIIDVENRGAVAEPEA